MEQTEMPFKSKVYMNEEDTVWADKLFMNALRACHNYYQTTDHFKLNWDYWSQTSFGFSLQKITIWIVLDKVDVVTKHYCTSEKEHVFIFSPFFIKAYSSTVQPY